MLKKIEKKNDLAQKTNLVILKKLKQQEMQHAHEESQNESETDLLHMDMSSMAEVADFEERLRNDRSAQHQLVS